MSSILTVSQINTYLSFKIKNDPKLKGVAVKGEISNLSVNQKSGHIYFTLKDISSSIKAVMFYSNVARLKFMPLPGQSVVAFGNIDVYERDGVYQIVVNELLPVGEGESLLALAKLKSELEQMGVFSAQKKEICKFPKSIAVVTSANGAALQDIINIISRRYPIVKLSVFSTLVQGIYAPASVSKALRSADASGADTIILARGGGSSEDLSAFNTKEVALAVFECNTPVISAIGHETDWSFADLVADLRAPTPSGAAELAVPDIKELLTEVVLLKNQISSVMASKISYNQSILLAYREMLDTLSPKQKIISRINEVERFKIDINHSVTAKLNVSKLALESVTEMLESLNPLNVLNRGYAAVIVNGKAVSDINAVSCGDEAKILLKGGSFMANVTDIKKTET